MKFLIINIDDAGFSREINEAVKRCCEAGLIFSVSVMPCGHDFEDACLTLKSIERIGVGVHLALTGGLYPASSIHRVKSLTDENGFFACGYKDFILKYYSGGINLEHIYREFYKQIKKVTDEGFRVTHLDSHEHVHMLPAIMSILVRLAKEFSIPYIRLSSEKISIIKKRFRFLDLLRYTALKTVCCTSKNILTGSGIKYNNAFFGHFHSGRLTDDIMLSIIKDMKDGINEIAFHPAVDSREFILKYPWYKNSHKELEVLTKGKWREKISKESVRLITHSDV